MASSSALSSSTTLVTPSPSSTSSSPPTDASSPPVKTASIPIFDLSQPHSTSALGAELVRAAAEHGFLFIRSVPGSVPFSGASVAQTFALARRFFTRSTAQDKAAVAMTPDNRGYTAVGGELLDPSADPPSAAASGGGGGGGGGDPKEAFNFGEFDPRTRAARQPLPPAFAEPAAEAHFAHFEASCHALGLAILRLLAAGLAIDDEAGGEEWFARRHDRGSRAEEGGKEAGDGGKARESGTILRLLHYPQSQSRPSPAKGKAGPNGAANGADAVAKATVRAGAHSDYGSLTLLFRLPGQPGLEIQTSPGGAWAAVPVSPPGTEHDAAPPVLVNIGDLLSYWTGGLLRSTVHRVVGGGGGVGSDTGSVDADRYSVAYFMHPARDTPLVPVPSDAVRRRVEENRANSANGGGHHQVGYGSGAGDAARRAQGMGGGAADKVITADQHLYGRLAATYGWGKEVEGKS